jgi:uncharacterized membrane protein
VTPQPTRSWNRRAAAWAARGSFASITLLIGLATALKRTGPEPLWAAVDLPFRLVCHRLPERVLSIAGAPMPVCSRCAGIWFGLSLGATLSWPALSLRALRYVVAFAAALLVAELVTQDLGLHPICHATRLGTGLLLALPCGGAIGSLMLRPLGSPAPTTVDPTADQRWSASPTNTKNAT